MRRLSFGDGIAGSAELLGEILQLRQAIFDPEDGFTVVYVNAGFEVEAGQHCREHVDQAKTWMICQYVPTAIGAVFPRAAGGLVVAGEVLVPLGHLDRRRLPEREGIDR